MAHGIFLLSTKKSHICEEGGGTSQYFFPTFINKLEKQLFIKRSVEVCQ